MGWSKMLKYKIRLKIYKGGKEIMNTISKKRNRIYYLIQEARGRTNRYYIKVLYSGGTKNEGEWTTKKDTIHAIGAFTEAGLLRS